MAAGLGFKTFTTGEVLTAADVNGYLNSQTVMVFADATARTAAITSPQEGMITYLKDTNVTQYYSGSAWANVGGGSPLTTKGDLYTYSTADARLAVGTNDTVLTADSTAATGLKWAAPASGGMTLISTTTVSGSTVTLSSIPQTYNDLVLILKNIYGSTAGANFSLRFNGVGTGSTYDNLQSYETTLNGSFDDNQVRVLENQANTSSQGLVSIYIPNYTNTTSWKFAHTVGVQNDSSDANWRGRNTIGFSNATSAVSSLTIFAAAGTFTAGTILLYGVK